MDADKCRVLIKNFFETLYNRRKSIDEVLVKTAVIEDNELMWAEGCQPDKDGWVTWKLVPAQVSDKEIEELEEEIGAKLPQVLKIFLTTYFHYFYEEIGENPVNEKFEGFLSAWNPTLVDNGYLPFAWDKDGYYIRCIDLKAMPEEEKCPIVQIDHEILFDLDEDITGRAELEEEMQIVAENFFQYLELILEDTSKK